MHGIPRDPFVFGFLADHRHNAAKQLARRDVKEIEITYAEANPVHPICS
jgi:hypothetical protein